MDVEKYGKDELKESERYKARKDLLEALLDEKETYSIAEVDRIIKRFMKGSVR